MKHPFMKKFPVFEHHYEEKTIPVTIYSYFEKFVGDGDDYEEETEDNINEEELSISRRDSYEKNNITKKTLSQITLQSLLDNLPEEVKPSDVKIGVNINYNCMAVEGTTVTFYYDKHFPARPELYKQEKELYDKEYREYEIKKSAYDKWLKNNEIRELKEKLAKAKLGR